MAEQRGRCGWQYFLLDGGTTWTLRNKIVTPQPLFRIKNGGKLIIAVYKDLRGEDRPLTEGEVKVRGEDRPLTGGR